MEKIVDTLLKDILTEQELPGFLESIARNLQYGYINQLLIYNQCRDAFHVSGRMALQSRKAKMDQTNPILLVYPQLADEDGEYQYHYLGVVAYSEMDAQDQQKTDEAYNLPDLIPARLQATVEVWEDADMPGKKAEFIEDERIIKIAKSCNSRQSQQLLEMYIKWMMEKRTQRAPFPDGEQKAIDHAVRYIVKSFFGIQPYSVGSVWKNVEDSSTHSKYIFLKETIHTAQLIVYDLIGYCMNYEELCLYQQVVRGADPSEICRALDEVSCNTKDKSIQETAKKLRKKLDGSTADTLANLDRLHREAHLFSYPAVLLEEYQSGIFIQRSNGSLY